MSEKCEVFDIIITLVKSFKTLDSNGNPHVISKYENKEIYLWNCKYLLNQVLRNYNVPPERYHITKAAKSLWDSITDENIKNYYYREKVVNKKLKFVEVKEYKGSSKHYNLRKISRNESFIYRDVFHNEHVIPIDMIIDELINLPNPDDYASIEQILNKIHICRMLKEEDRRIPPGCKSARPNNYDEVLRDVYGKAEPIIEVEE